MDHWGMPGRRMATPPGMPRRFRAPVLASYAAFVFVGVNAGVSGVLLPSQMSGYGVDRATIGITFFIGAAGFAFAGLSNGALIHRSGIRLALTTGGGAYVLAGLYLASRPPFAAFVLAQFVTGYATGVLESVHNSYLAALPDATTLLNRLHAFFGVGALAGPALAAWIVSSAPWTVVWLVLALTCIPLTAGFVLIYPDQAAEPEPAALGPAGPGPAGAGAAGRLLAAALRDRSVLLGATMLAVYVGLELSVGNWGFSYLVQARGLPGTLAGYSVSGYWLGLTLGRFLISPIAIKIGVTTARMMYACLAGITVAATLAWLAPDAALATAALMLLGFFLGPVFPTTMAIAPQLTRARLAPTAIGVMNAGSMVGGAVLPWLAGVITQATGMWTLLPFGLVLALLQFAVWRPLTVRIRGNGGENHAQPGSVRQAGQL
jgi:fucose permease